MLLMNGLITGVLFGALLQRCEILRYDRQLGALLFQDMTIIKFMLTAILVAMAGIHLLVEAGQAQLAVKPLVLGGNVLGGLVFGAGWALLGYCPATSVGAVAEGRWDALWGLVGALAGAALYAWLYPYFKVTLLTMGVYGPLTLPVLLGVPAWGVIAVAVMAGLLLFRVFNRYGL